MKADILDCTLRDGGYVNNWNFSAEAVHGILTGLYNSGVRYIEVGIMDTAGKGNHRTKFSNFKEIEPVLENRKSDCHYAVMITTENGISFDPPTRNEKTPDIIRLAYFKPDCKRALAMAERFQRKGYSVFLQAMATYMYSELELSDMLQQVCGIRPGAFFLVDSFSTLYPKDIRHLRDFILLRVPPEIPIGFHAHNNMQMAFANTQEFLRTDNDHQFFADSTIFGMGRGAGNLPTELLMEYLNQDGMKYNTSYILSIFQNYLLPVYQEFGWGYSMQYFLTATHKVNPAYGWYFSKHGIHSLDTLNQALEHIPKDARFSLNTAIANDIIGGTVD